MIRDPDARRWRGVAVLGMILAVLAAPAPLTAAEKPEGKRGQADGAKGNQPQKHQAAKRVGWLPLYKPLREKPVPFAWAAGQATGLSLRDVVQSLGRVADDDRYLGVVIHLDGSRLSITQVAEIGRAMKAVRAKGKKVLVFADRYNLINYLLACSADQILLQHKGLVMLSGLNLEEMYVKGLLEKVGIGVDLHQIGKFKGAAEPLMRQGPSDSWSENVEKLLDDLYDQILSRIAEARKLNQAQVEKVFADSWAMTDTEYVKRRVIDRLTSRDLVTPVADVFGGNFTWHDLIAKPARSAGMDNPFVLLRMLFQPSKARVRRPSIALIHAVGPIASGEGLSADQANLLFGGDRIGSRTMVKALRQAIDNDMIKGVVIRVDSPGGSALASEMIWQAVREAAKVKPVFISVGRVAASGGYYIACAGDRIYVSPGSLVGSIGVVGGKLTLGGLYEKLGINIHRRSRGPLGDIFNSVEPFTPPQRKVLEAAMQNIYDQFTERVATGRGDRLADMDAVAQGRIFTGRQAVDNHLADKLGGLEAALKDMAEKLGLAPGKYDIVNLPPPMSLAEFMDKLFGDVSTPKLPLASATALAARQLVGPRAWRAVQPVLSGLTLLRHEPVLTLMPVAIVVH